MYASSFFTKNLPSNKKLTSKQNEDNIKQEFKVTTTVYLTKKKKNY